MFQTEFVQKIKTHILCSVTFFFENHAVYEKKWKNIVERGRPQMTIWRTRIACWVPKVTHTHTHTHTLTICNTYCFAIATMVARTLLNVTSSLPILLLYNLGE